MTRPPSLRRTVLPLALSIVVVVLSACATGSTEVTTGASGPTQTGAAATGPTATGPTAPTGPTGVTLAGTWTGSWESEAPGVSGTFTMKIEQTGSGFTGTIAIADTPCVSNGSVIGSVDGDTINFGAVEAENEVAFSGSISGDSMSGTYQSPPACGSDSGTWKATRS